MLSVDSHAYLKTKTLGVLLFLLLASLPAAASSSQEYEVIVQVLREGDTVTVEASMHVPVDPPEAWAVLTDYDHMTEFVSNLQTCKITNREPLRVEQKGRARYGPLFFSFEAIREIELIPHETIKTRNLSGNMRKMESQTRISAEAGGTRITYRSVAIPDFWLPPLIGPAFIRHEVAEQFRFFIKEMIRRKNPA